MGLTCVQVTVAAVLPSAGDSDPYLWLEERHGERAMQWVAAQNAVTLRRLQGDARYAGFYREALAIASTDRRIPLPSLIGGRVFNLWRDGRHPHGVWRSSAVASFRQDKPVWTTSIDLDALGKAENRNWVWHDVRCLEPEQRLCLIALSDGGEDAVTYREFDLERGRFVAGGFELPTAVQDVNWLDENTLIVSRKWGEGTMTASGFPFVVKKLRRGEALSSATEVFRGAASDQNSSFGVVLSDAQGHRLPLIERGTVFTGSATFLLSPQGALPLALPAKIELSGMIDGQVILRSSEEWTTARGDTITAGTLVAVSAADLDGRREIAATVLFKPNVHQSIKDVVVTRTRVILSLLDDVRGRAVIIARSQHGWKTTLVTLPEDSSIDLLASSSRDEDAYLAVTSFLQPTTLWSLDAASGKANQVKAAAPTFDASRATTERFAAIASDGTRIPYFVVHRKAMPLDGSTPALMTAYGGFSFSNTPEYLNATGKLWVERGGSFVLANIRGGGEFGPRWHEAALKTRRQVAYDDFAAVARDLFSRGFSSPARLGIYGRSNGGLLMGVELNQHPDLWGAVVMEVPMLDLMRYEQIEAGASWVDEWGSVTVPAEKAFLRTISPYLNLRKTVNYPEPFIWTTSGDDRVGPQHGRKFAARMQGFGLPCLFYEDLVGGHAGDADIAQSARLLSLKMVYFSEKLLKPR